MDENDELVEGACQMSYLKLASASNMEPTLTGLIDVEDGKRKMETIAIKEAEQKLEREKKRALKSDGGRGTQVTEVNEAGGVEKARSIGLDSLFGGPSFASPDGLIRAASPIGTGSGSSSRLDAEPTPTKQGAKREAEASTSQVENNK